MAPGAVTHNKKLLHQIIISLRDVILEFHVRCFWPVSHMTKGTLFFLSLRMMLSFTGTLITLRTRSLQLAINALHQWSEKWLLSLNSNKIVSYGRTVDTSAVYTIMDKNQRTVLLATLNKIKDTDVYFDAKLDFKDHMHEKNKQGIYDVRLN